MWIAELRNRPMQFSYQLRKKTSESLKAGEGPFRIFFQQNRLALVFSRIFPLFFLLFLNDKHRQADRADVQFMHSMHIFCRQPK